MNHFYMSNRRKDNINNFKNHRQNEKSNFFSAGVCTILINDQLDKYRNNAYKRVDISYFFKLCYNLE